MTPPKRSARVPERPEWLPVGVSIVDHVRDAARRAGPPPELENPDTDWDWDSGDLFAEAWRTGCIPASDLRRAMGARGEDKPQWYMELKAASGDPLYIRDRPQIAKAAASGQLGDRARRVHQHLASRGLIAKTSQQRPEQQPSTASPPAAAHDEDSALLPKATWKRVGQKTAEITLTTATKRRYRAEGEMIDRLLSAAVSTGRLSDPKRMTQAPAGDDADLGTLPNGHRHAVNKDRTSAASAAPLGAKTVEITIIATTTRRYLATDSEALRICVAAETLGALHDRSRMLTNHTLQPAEMKTPQPNRAARDIRIGL
ncbi:MAG: hypothetical protein OXT07_03625 [bacterium]|nr:hypothetical protein [bacterium]MDE0216476.1 hypothetical protein [bacterium]